MSNVVDYRGILDAPNGVLFCDGELIGHAPLLIKVESDLEEVYYVPLMNPNDKKPEPYGLLDMDRLSLVTARFHVFGKHELSSLSAKVLTCQTID